MTIHIDLVPHAADVPHPLGRHVEHDDRSRYFAFPKTGAMGQTTVVWPTKAPVLNQGQLGACTGNATAQLLNTDHYAAARAKANHGRYLNEAVAREIYSLATRLDNITGEWKPNDTGSTGIAAAKAGVQLGYFTGYKHAFGFDHFRAAIQSQPVIVGTVWTHSMFTPDANGVVTVGDLTQDNIAGGHEYLVRGINYQTGQVLCRNSWGAGWGFVGPDNVPGSFYIGFFDFEALLEQQGDVTVPIGVA